MAEVDVLIVGAGVSGLTTAVCLAETGLRVTVRTATDPERTTSAVAGALWMPYLVRPVDRVTDWGATTLTELRTLADEPTTGVRRTTGVVLAPTAMPPPAWTGTVAAVPCRPEDLADGYEVGWRFGSVLVEMPTYLGYLADRLRVAGGRIEPGLVPDLAEALTVAPIVVNCAGIGARELVPDPGMRPVRGQVVVVENPGIDEFVSEHPGESPWLKYVLPHRDTVVLGGTAEPDRNDLAPDPSITARILADSVELVPALAGAPVLAERVGLRPARPEVRLEVEDRPEGRIIHNYGHGGGGVTLSWGCAREAAHLVAGS